MKKFFLLLFSLLTFVLTQAQKITGLWYSSDSSRIYEIKEPGMIFIPLLSNPLKEKLTALVILCCKTLPTTATKKI